ncbi:MAG TPA: hypothetical protein H9881_17340 [Candidatus Stackebrandtia excrementipullorum]|nr:hypothetical protein [Candidatus Stackebrandtia excrementipullorum]
MQDAWRAYLELALGVTEASRKKATEVIRSLAEQSGAKVEDLQGMAEGLLTAGMANRESLTKLVRYELDRALGKVGLATTDEVEQLKEKVRALELQLRDAREQAAEAEQTAVRASRDVASGGTAEKSVKTASKKTTTAKKTTAKKAPAQKSTKKAVKKTAKKAVKKSAGGNRS